MWPYSSHQPAVATIIDRWREFVTDLHRRALNGEGMTPAEVERLAEFLGTGLDDIDEVIDAAVDRRMDRKQRHGT